MTPDLRLMGSVTRPHGVRGEMKVRPETDDPSRFERLDPVYLGPDERSAVPYGVRSVRYQAIGGGTAVVLALRGVETREAAAALAGQAVWADSDQLPELEEGEVYVSDLVGLAVRLADGSPVGSVADVLDLPAQPVLVVRRPDAGDALVPFVPAFIESTSVEDGEVVIRPVEGLLDPEAQETVD